MNCRKWQLFFNVSVGHFYYPDIRRGENDGRGDGLQIHDAEGDRQVGAGAPEGVFRLVEEQGLGGMRDRVDSGLAEDGAGLACGVEIEAGADAVGVGRGVGAVADDYEPV